MRHPPKQIKEEKNSRGVDRKDDGYKPRTGPLPVFSFLGWLWGVTVSHAIPPHLTILKVVILIFGAWILRKVVMRYDPRTDTVNNSVLIGEERKKKKQER